MVLCPECGGAQATIQLLKLHMQFSHKFNPNDSISCKEDNCDRDFECWAKYRRHIVSEHIQGNISVSKVTSSPHSERVDVPHIDEVYVNEESGSDINDDSLSSFFSQAKEDMFKIYLRFVGKMYADPMLPRSAVQSSVNDLSSVLHEIFSLLESMFQGQTIRLKDKSIVFSDLTDIFLSPLARFASEHKRLKELINTKCLIEPQPVKVASVMEDRRIKQRIVKDIVPLLAYTIPMGKVLSCFFSLPGVLDKTLKYMTQLQNNKLDLSNFIQGSLWVEKKETYFAGKIVIPLFLYYDDFEVNNPLGSHCVVQKLGGTYFSIPCIPYEYRSQLENIFMAELCHASDRTDSETGNYRNKEIFRNIVDQINLLQANGVYFKEHDITVYFALGQILGDNEGLNSTLGFLKGFRANYFCRLCLVHRNQTERDTRERVQFLRDENNYAFHVSSKPSESGIKEDSIWNEVVGHHVYKNVSVDIFHDIHEGCLKYGMYHIVNHFVYKAKKKVSLETINGRIKSFDYYGQGISNRPPVISENDMLKEKRIKISGSEMLNFVLLFAMLVGDLVDCRDKVWLFYLTIRRIVHILIAPSLQKETSGLLNSLVAIHHKMYCNLFKDTLKPKHHFMVHYGRLLKLLGPLCHLSTIRFEAKHRTQVQRANATFSRKNITYTISLKEQLQLCFRLVSGCGFEPRRIMGPTSLPLNTDEDNIMFPLNFGPKYVELSWVEINGVKYKPNLLLVISFEENGLPCFGSISKIFFDEKDSVCLLYECMLTIGFNEDLYAYEITHKNMMNTTLFENIHCTIPAVFYMLSDGQMYATLKFAL